MTKELLRCPFCGSEAKLCSDVYDYTGEQYWIECTNDNCICTADFDTEEEAIEKWNKRCYNKDSWTIDVPKEEEQELIDIIERGKNNMSDWTKVETENKEDCDIKEYVIRQTETGYKGDTYSYLSYYDEIFDNHSEIIGVKNLKWTDDIDNSFVFPEGSNIVPYIYKYFEGQDCCITKIEVEQSMTSWCNGDKSGSHRTVMPVSKGPGIIPTLSAEVEGLREENKKLKEQVGDLYTKNIGDIFAALEDTEYLKEENKRLKDLEIRAYNLLTEANNHLDVDDDGLRLEIEDWIKDSLDNPFSPDVISDKENE